jgi:hypothetical protein
MLILIFRNGGDGDWSQEGALHLWTVIRSDTFTLLKSVPDPYVFLAFRVRKFFARIRIRFRILVLLLEKVTHGYKFIKQSKQLLRKLPKIVLKILV